MAFMLSVALIVLTSFALPDAENLGKRHRGHLMALSDGRNTWLLHFTHPCNSSEIACACRLKSVSIPRKLDGGAHSNFKNGRISLMNVIKVLVVQRVSR